MTYNIMKCFKFQNDEPEGSDDIPKPDESYNIDIPGSVTLWEARPRPPNTAQVNQGN